METKTISIAKDFSRYPAGRYISDGPFSGEAFRDSILVPAFTSGDSLTIDLEGARGYGSSFLEEAFGGMIRKGFAAKEMLAKIDFKSQDQSLIEEIREYILDQAKVSGQI